MMEESSEGGENVINQLSEAVNTNVTLAAQTDFRQATTTSFSVSQVQAPTLLPPLQPLQISSNPNPQASSLITQFQQPTAYGANLLASGPPLVSAGTPTPGPPPKSGFQPVPHVVQNYETHHPQGSSPASPDPSARQAPGVNIFIPTYDPNTPLSHYPGPPLQQTEPAFMQSPYEASSAIEVGVDSGYATPASYKQQTSQDLGLFDWLRSNETVNKVMQKAKSGVQHVITTLDPQMKDVLYSGGDVSVVVASTKDVKVVPVKEAFQNVFGRATVYGMDSQPNVAPQPVGFSSGLKGAEERINNLRLSGIVKPDQVCIAVESFIVDLQSESWYDVACLVLNDPVRNITLHTFSQATPVSPEYVLQAQRETPSDYNLAWSGLAVTVGQVMQRHCAIDSSDWHFYFTGVSRRDLLYLSAKQLAFMYKNRLARQ